MDGSYIGVLAQDVQYAMGGGGWGVGAGGRGQGWLIP